MKTSHIKPQTSPSIENLKEALSQVIHKKEQAEHARDVNQLLLNGLRALLEADSSQDMYQRMFEIFQKIIVYEVAFVLEQHAPGVMKCTRATHSSFVDSEWLVDPVLKRTILGQPCAVYAVERQPSWQAHLKQTPFDIQSCLYCPFSGPDINAVLVFCHSTRGFYVQSHASMAEQYRDFMQQTLLSVDAKLKALESQQLRREKEKAEKHLLQAEKMASLGVLAAGVAHEINNPIGYVNSNFSYLAEQVEDIQLLYQKLNNLLNAVDDGSTSELEEAARNAKTWLEAEHIHEAMADLKELVTDCQFGLKKVSDIVQELRKFARTDEESSAEVDINACINSTLKLVANELKYHCELDIDLDHTELVMANEGKINQVLTNLLVNAGHAIEDKGKICVRSGITNHPEIGPCSWFSIEDNGCGIAPENIDRIFEPFYTSKEVGKGTGLGLAISYSIIEKFGGTLEVNSELNKGTCFTAYIQHI